MFDAYQFLFRLILCGDNPVCGSASIYTVLVEFISVYLIVGVVSRSFGVATGAV